MTDAVIVSTARTALAKSWRGSFNMTHGATLGGHVVQHAVARAGIDPAEVEDVIMGCATPEGATGSNIARQIALRAGLPVTAAGVTVNRFCSSGLQTIAMAAQRVIVDKVPVMVAGGVESISCVQNEANRHMIMEAWLKQNKPEVYWPMLQTAETVAKRYNIPRELQDEYGARSQQRAAAAQAAGKFNDEIVPITVDRRHRRQGQRPPAHPGSDGVLRRGHPRRHHGYEGRRQDQAGDSRRRDCRRQRQPVLRRRLGLRGDGCEARRRSATSSRSASSAASPSPAASRTRWASARSSPSRACSSAAA
jgi:acetyl-CoA acetyltransferase